MAPRFGSQVRRHQRHHLVGALAQRAVLVAAGRRVRAARAQRPVVEPVSRHHEHILRERADLVGRGVHEPRACEALAQGHDRVALAARDAVEPFAQLAAAPHEVVQVAVQEAVLVDAFEHEVQVEPQVLDRLGTLCTHGRRNVDALLEAREELADDLVLVAEVVVEVAGAHAERLGDHPRGDVRLAQLVEEAQALGEDAGPRPLRADGIAVDSLRHDGGEPITPPGGASAAGRRARPGGRRRCARAPCRGRGGRSRWRGGGAGRRARRG